MCWVALRRSPVENRRQAGCPRLFRVRDGAIERLSTVNPDPNPAAPGPSDRPRLALRQLQPPQAPRPHARSRRSRAPEMPTRRTGSPPVESTPPSDAAAGTSISAPMPPESKQLSASVTASPPSEQSCADSSRPLPARSTSSRCSAASAARSSAGGRPRSNPCTVFKYSLPPSSPWFSPNWTIDKPTAGNARARTVLASSMTPTTPMTGVGRIGAPSVSLYRLTLPPVIGRSSARHASPMPATASANCHMISGRSGLPKFRQLVAPTGSPPAHATLRAASATARRAPSLGSRRQKRPLPSTDIASARPVPLTRTTPAPSPASTIVFVRTM